MPTANSAAALRPKEESAGGEAASLLCQLGELRHGH